MSQTDLREKVTLPDLTAMKQRGLKITTVTAYDAPSARLAEAAGIELLLVGDSAAMTLLGHESTLPVTIDEMLMLTRAVSRGASRPLIVADLPFGSFQGSDEQAVASGVRFLKEGGADAVKVEGAGRTLSRVRALVEAGIPVMGHLGLTPQSATLLGGYRAQARTAADALRCYDAARALEAAGCFALVLEAVPPPVAERVTAALTVPTIGIGAGVSCDGQVLVWHDLLGLTLGAVPRFVKSYANLSPMMLQALRDYVTDVRAGTFPEPRHTYSMADGERERFDAMMASGDDCSKLSARSEGGRRSGHSALTTRRQG